MSKRSVVVMALFAPGLVVVATLNWADDPPDKREAAEESTAAASADGRALLQLEFEALDVNGADKATQRPRGIESWDAGLNAGPIPPKVINQDKIIPHCLMITDLKVVNDPRAEAGGKWSFGYLMRAMANTQATGIKPEEFVNRWLAHWDKDQQVNGFTAPARPIKKVLDAWPKLANGDLDLDKAPFRLLAIVNRVDLRSNLVLSVPRIGGGGAGEARFVFGFVDAGGPQQFTVIFEYGIKRRTFDGVQHWAQQWYDLKDLAMGSPEYLERLESITEQFARAAVDPEQPPNGSALAQLRTNEIFLTAPWELREFRLDAHNGGYLRQVTVKQTPDKNTVNEQPVLVDFIMAHKAAIDEKRHSVPVEFPTGSNFLAASALTPSPAFQWELPAGAPDLGDTRKFFSLGTCNGCHAGETDPDTVFTHVKPRAANVEAGLSNFLIDAGGELEKRDLDLRQLLEIGETFESKRLPLQFVH